MSQTIEQLYRGQLEPKNVLGNGNVEMRILSEAVGGADRVL